MINKVSLTLTPIGGGRYVLNANQDGTARTLTCVHYCATHITQPRGGFVEMGVLEITDYENNKLRNER